VKVPERRRNRAIQNVSVEIQAIQFAAIAKLRRYVSGQEITREIQLLQLLKVAKSVRDGAIEVVCVQEEDRQATAIAELRRNVSKQRISRQIQYLQSFKLTKTRRNPTSKSDTEEVQGSDTLI
jgi:outer membrane lipopolysaccharide assembly protein LptE/RlpB